MQTLKMSKNEQIPSVGRVGYLGHYGKSSDLKYNLKVDKVNKLIDEFNANVDQLPSDKQVEYLNSIQRMCREILLAD
jgi:hypothetical protein